MSNTKVEAYQIAYTAKEMESLLDKVKNTEQELVDTDNPISSKVVLAKFQELQETVDNGKLLIANAITEKGVESFQTNTFEELANNILAIIGKQPESGPGLYDAKDILLCTWEDSGIDVEIDYTDANYKTETTSPYYVLTNDYPQVRKVVMPSEITKIGANAFRDCQNLTDVKIPNYVTTIGQYAFCNCISLSKIEIPYSVTNITDLAFYNCPDDIIITVDELNNTFCSVDNVLFSKDMKTLYLYPNKKETSYVIPDGVTTIYQNAFRECTKLTNITIPDSVTSIGAVAFYKCNLTEVIMPNVTNIGTSAFNSCASLVNVVLSNNIKTIGQTAFHSCTSLASITLPEGLQTIESAAFRNCTSLTNITLPEGLQKIGSGAFRDCAINLIEFPSSLRNIGNNVIYTGEVIFNCNVPGASDYMSGVFYGSEITKVTFNEGITEIGRLSFNACKKLTSVVIPNSVTYIGDYAFSQCEKLTNVTFKDTTTWYIKDRKADDSQKTQISVTNASTNATNIITTYNDKVWLKV